MREGDFITNLGVFGVESGIPSTSPTLWNESSIKLKSTLTDSRSIIGDGGDMGDVFTLYLGLEGERDLGVLWEFLGLGGWRDLGVP